MILLNFYSNLLLCVQYHNNSFNIGYILLKGCFSLRQKKTSLRPKTSLGWPHIMRNSKYVTVNKNYKSINTKIIAKGFKKLRTKNI